MEPAEEYLTHAVVFHRKLGSVDESSTEDEQKEKILFYFPSDVSVSGQLSKMSMIEGLIDFTNKFSTESIEYVTMENDTWAFKEVEPEVWIVVAMKNDTRDVQNDLPFRHRPNGRAMVRTLERIYSLYRTFHGGFERTLAGPTGKGWEAIGNVCKLKKRIRKLDLRLRQEV